MTAPGSDPTAEPSVPGPAEPRPQIPPVGGIEGRFELLDELGTGSSGTVYRARLLRPLQDLAAGDEVAVKFLRQDLAADPEAQARLRAEGRLGLGIHSRHVVRILAVESMPLLGLELSYVVMELIPGHSLREFLDARGPITSSGGGASSFARRVGADTALGLAALHRLGIVHRDVKPENLRLTPDGDVKLMDLGLARPIAEGGDLGSTRATGSGGFFGSLAYAAPERLLGLAAAPASDLYSLGVVLHEVLTGEHPFADATDADAMIRAHLERPVAPLARIQPRVGPFLDELVRTLLDKDPAKRLAGRADRLAKILEAGERSDFWLARERTRPGLVARTRLHRVRRPTPTALFGRDEELRRLDDQFARAARGRARVVAVVGSQGIGRRRLLDEAVGRWIDRGQRLVYLAGVAEPQPRGQRGAPFPGLLVDWLLDGDAVVGSEPQRARDRIRARVEERFGDVFAASALDELVEALAGRAPGTAGPPGILGNRPLPAAVRVARLADALVEAARSEGASGRTLVARIDFAHDLGTIGRAVLRRLAGVRERAPLLVLLTVSATPDPRPDAPRAVAGRRVLRLRGLATASWRALGDGLFRDGNAPWEPEWLEAARLSLAGNPGALVDAFDDLVQRGLVRGRLGDLHHLSPEVLRRPLEPAPRTVARLRSRVERMPDGDRFVLLAAAILGRRSRLADVAGLTGRPELEVLEVFARFQGRLASVVQREVVFRHERFRRAVVASAPAAVARTMARDAAWLREDRGADRLEVGLLLSRAGEHGAAVAPLLDGLGELLRQGALRAADRIARRVRLHLNALPRTARWLRHRVHWLLLHAETLERRADPGTGAVATRGPDDRRVWKQLRKANLIANHLDEPALRVRTLLALGTHAQVRGHFLAAQQLLTQARLRAADGGLESGEHEGPHLVGRVLAAHGRVLAWLGLAEAAARMTIEARRLLLPGSRDALHARIDLAVWESLRLHVHWGLRSLEKLGREAAARGEPQLVCRVDLHRGRLLIGLGRLDQALRILEAAAAAARECGERQVHARARLAALEAAVFGAATGIPHAALRTARNAAERARDRVAQGSAAAWAYAFDPDAPDPTAEIAEIGAPAIQAILVIARALRGSGERATGPVPPPVREEARQLLEQAALPLHLRLVLLRLAERPGRFRSTVDEVGSRMRTGTDRRAFQAFVRNLSLAGERPWLTASAPDGG